MKLSSIINHYRTVILLMLLLIISVPPRLWNLSTTPHLIVDEPAHVRDINKMLAAKNYSPATPMWDASQATIVLYPTIILIKLGVTDEYFALRMATVIFSLLSLIPFFFIVKKYTNEIVAYCITLLFSYSYFYLEFSRVGWLNIYGIFLGLILFLLLNNALEKFALWKFSAGGLLLGLLSFLYRGAEVYMISISLLLVKLLFIKRTKQQKIIALLLYLLTALVVAFPWIVTVSGNWQNYILRSRNVSIFNVSFPYHGYNKINTILVYQINTTIKSWIFLLPVQGGGVEDQRYLPLRYPPVNIFIIPLFWVGLFMALRNFKKTYVWLAIFITGLILGQILTVDPPNGARAFIILPVIYLFAALPLYYIYKVFSFSRYTAVFFIIFFSVVAYVDFVFYQFWMSWIQVWIPLH